MAPSTSPGRWMRRLYWAAAAIVFLAVAVAGVSLSLRSGIGRAALTERLAATFGRPVDVGSYDLSLQGGPQLQANFVTVEEDARFGHEYFLRAEKITARLRWTALLAGRFEFGTLTLTRPSLNLVRLPEGQWNLESWLPAPAAERRATQGPPAPVLRVRRVEVENGRINFKRGPDKHPFALTGVTGSFERQTSGEWRMNVEARPLRAGVAVQEPGTIRMTGRIGGTSARLRPADLSLRWEAASLSDALRLARGFDYGMRGELDADARVQAAPPSVELSGPAGYRWDFSGALRLRGVHRWDFPPQDSDPSVNVSLEAGWWPALARVEVSKTVVEGPATQIRGSGFVQWGRPPAGLAADAPAVSRQPDSRLQFVSSGISLADLFAWYRAFRSGVQQGVAVEGNAGLDLQLDGWPVRVRRLTMASPGARLRVPGLADPPGFAQAVLRYDATSGRISLPPVNLRFGPAGAAPTGTLRLAASVTPRGGWAVEWSVNGTATRAHDALTVAAALGMEPAASWLRRGWSVEGSAELALRWAGTLLPPAAQPSGTIRLRNLSLHHSLFAEPFRMTAATVELLAAGPRVSLQEARTFGALWSGRLERRGQWRFALSADSLNLTELARGLAPPVQQRTLLQRLTPSQAAPPLLGDALPALRAQGRVQLRRLELSPLVLERFRGTVTLDGTQGWQLELTAAEAQFYSGVLRGSYVLRGGTSADASQPSHGGEMAFSGVNVAALTAAAPRLRGLFAGAATGEFSFTATGEARDALLDSLRGEGRIEFRNAVWNGADLRESLRLGATRPGRSSFLRASASFTLAGRRLRVAEVQLAGASPRDLLAGEGSVDISAPGLDLDFRFTAGAAPAILPAGATAGAEARPSTEFRLTGPLRGPQVAASPVRTP